MLAELLMERGGEKEWQEAIQLVEPARGDRSMPEVDRRMEGILLARRGGKENLDQARQIFEELVADPKKANAFDRQRLAQLYELDGKPELARQQYLKLVSGKAPSPAQLAAYVGLLLRYERYDEADSWLKKLESLAPDDLGVVMLRARWLHGTNKDALIEPLVQPLVEKLMKTAADDKQQEAAIALRVGALYSVVGQPAAAERWYRRLAELQPDRYEPLANTLRSRAGYGRPSNYVKKRHSPTRPCSRPWCWRQFSWRASPRRTISGWPRRRCPKPWRTTRTTWDCCLPWPASGLSNSGPTTRFNCTDKFSR